MYKKRFKTLDHSTICVSKTITLR